MMTISIRDAQISLAELALRVEKGETIVVTRDGRPILDLTPYRQRRGLDFEAGREYLRARGITNPAPFIVEDFNEPLPEDVLLRPLP